MSRLLRLSLVGVFAFALACYHATVDTGLKPSAQVVEKSFAAGWIFGLVPPSTVATASQCSHGAAKIETQLSFVNQLVAFLTLDIFTPMSIKVTCAEGGRASVSPTAPTIDVGADATPEQIRDAISRAVGLSLRANAPTVRAARRRGAHRQDAPSRFCALHEDRPWTLDKSCLADLSEVTQKDG